MTATITIGTSHGGTGATTTTAARTNLGISGTSGTIPKFGANSVLGDSALTQTGSDITGAGKIAAVTLEANASGRAITATGSVSVNTDGTIYATTATAGGNALYVENTGTGSGRAATIKNNNLFSALYAQNTGAGRAISAVRGSANPASTSPDSALYAESSSEGRAIQAMGHSDVMLDGTIKATNTSTATGNALFAENTGVGNTGSAIYATNGSTGHALYATTSASGTTSGLGTVVIENTGGGNGIHLSNPSGGQCILAENTSGSGRTMRVVGNNSSTGNGTLVVENSTAGNALLATNTTGVSIRATSAIAGSGSNTTTGTAHIINTGTGLALYADGGSAGDAINTMGNIRVNGTLVLLSSLSVKDILAPSKDIEDEAVDLFQSIPLSKYTYKDTYKSRPKNNAPIYGIIAEHLNEVMPQAVRLDCETPLVDKNMVFELALVALQNALKRIEILEAKGV